MIELNEVVSEDMYSVVFEHDEDDHVCHLHDGKLTRGRTSVQTVLGAA